MSATTQTRAAALDLNSVSELRRSWNEARGLYWVELEYLGTDRYTVSGWSDGTGAVCCDDCPAWRFRQACKHASSFPLFLDELARREQATKTTTELLAALAFWDHQSEPLSPDQRLAANACRAVLASRGVRPSAAARAAKLARGRAAVSELFDEAG